MKENVIEINSANYDAAYAMADEQTRKVLNSIRELAPDIAILEA